MRPRQGNILTSDMALKQRHRTAETVTNNTEKGWNCDSDRENRKYAIVKINTNSDMASYSIYIYQTKSF